MRSLCARGSTPVSDSGTWSYLHSLWLRRQSVGETDGSVDWLDSCVAVGDNVKLELSYE